MNCMIAGKTFVDTNILIYAYDASAGRKHEVAYSRLADLWSSETAMISTQVLQEFYVNITRKIAKPLTAKAARAILEDLSRMEVIAPDSNAILSAIDLHQEYKLSFWDALIVMTAYLGAAETLLTEDLNNGQIIKGVKIVNPFI